MNNAKTTGSSERLIAIITIIVVVVLTVVSIFLTLKTEAEKNPANIGSAGVSDGIIALDDGQVPLGPPDGVAVSITHNSSVTINSAPVSSGTIGISPDADVAIQLADEKNFKIISVSATDVDGNSIAVSGSGNSYSISAADAANLASISIVTEEVAVEPPAPAAPMLLGGPPVTSSETPSSGADIDQISIAGLSDEVFSGETAIYSATLSATGVEGVIILVPMSANHLSITHEGTDFKSGPVSVSGHPVVPDGNYFAIEVPNALNPSGVRPGFVTSLALNYVYENGVTPPGTTQPIAAYAVEGVESSSPKISGGTLAIKNDGFVKADVPAGRVLTSKIDETFTISKKITSTEEVSAGTLAPRNYGDVNDSTKDAYTISYEIDLNSTGSGSETGRLFVDSITITDELLGFGTGSQLPSSIKVDGTSIILPTTSPYSFTIDVAGDSTTGFSSKKIAVDVTFSRKAYTKMYDGSSSITTPATINNTATATGTSIDGSSITITPIDNSVTTYIGYEQGNPSSAHLDIKKLITISGVNGDPFNTLWQTRMEAVPSFKLTPKSGSGTLTTGAVDGNGLLTFALTPGTTYTLTEDAIDGFTSSIASGVEVVVSNIKSDGSVDVTVGGTTVPTTGGYFEVTNTSADRGSIIVQVEQQQVGLMGELGVKSYTPVAAGIKVYLCDASGTILTDKSGNQIFETTDNSGQVRFWNLGVTTSTKYVLKGENRASENYVQNPASGLEINLIASSSSTSYRVQYDSTLGGIHIGKTFVSADGNPTTVSDNYVATFEISGGGLAAPIEFKVDKTNNPDYVTEYLPAGTYTITEKSLFFGTDNQTANFTMYSGTVTVAPGNFLGKPSDSDNDHKVKNVSKYGQLKVLKYASDGTTPMQGVAFTVTGPNSYSKLLTTDDSGQANVWVPAGEYEVKENPNPGYVQILPANNASIKLQIAASTKANANQTATFNNAILPTMTATKVSSVGGAGVSGATFQLYALNAAATAYVPYGTTTVTTDSTGAIEFKNLNLGKYILVETVTPPAYLPPESQAGIANLSSISVAEATAAIGKGMKSFEVTASDYGVSAPSVKAMGNITNVPAAKVSISKKSTKGGSNVTGATFELFKVGSPDVSLGTVNSGGSAVSFAAGLAAGDYYIVEKTPPSTYIARADKLSFSVDATGNISNGTFGSKYAGSTATASGSNLPVVFTNVPKPSLDVTKFGETNIFTDDKGTRFTRPLEGVEFQVLTSAGVPLNFISNGNGTYTVDSTGTVTKLLTGPGGALSIIGLDPTISASYTLRESPTTVDGIVYAQLPDQTITLTEVSNTTDGISHYTAAIDTTNNPNTVKNGTKFEITNKVEIHYVEIEKFNLYTKAGDEITTPATIAEADVNALENAFGGEFELYRQTSTGWELVETLVTGTMSPDELNTAISGAVTTGTYKLVETVPPAYANTPSATTPAYEKNGTNWVPITSPDPTKPEWVFTVDSAHSNAEGIVHVDLGNTGKTGPGTAPIYVRLLGTKMGYSLDANGNKTEQGALMGIGFNVTLAYLNGGTYLPIPDPASPTFTETTGIVDFGGVRSYGSFLTIMQSIKPYQDKGYQDFGFIVEELGPLPAGYDVRQIGQKFYVPIDLTKVVMVKGEQVVTVDLTMSNYVGTGSLEVNKYAFGTTTLLDGAAFDIYRAPGKDVTDRSLWDNIGSTVATAAGLSTTSLPTGYYYLVETTGAANYSMSGKYTVGIPGEAVTALTGATGDFSTGAAIGPIIINGSKKTIVKVEDRQKPSITIEALWNGTAKSGHDATYTVNGSTTTALSSLDDGTYLIIETGINSTAAAEYTKNADAASPGITVVVKDGQVTSINVDGTAVSTTPAPTSEAIWVTGNKISVNHLGAAALIIDMGWIDATGGKHQGDGVLKGATFDIKKEGSATSSEIAWSGSELRITKIGTDDLEEGTYIITQKTVDPDGFVIDSTPVYVEVKKGFITYLQNNDGTTGTEGTPIPAVAEGSTKQYFYNHVVNGELKIVKYDSTDSDKGADVAKRLPGAIFAFCESNGDPITATSVQFAHLVDIEIVDDGTGVYTTNKPIAPGTYYVKEVQAPEGYEAIDDVFTVEIKENGPATIGTTDVNVARVPNTLLGALTVHKVTEYPEIKVNGTVLAGTGIEFSVNGLPLALHRSDTEDGTYSPVSTASTWVSTFDNGRRAFKGLGVGYYKVIEMLPDDHTLDYLGLNSKYTSLATTPVIKITQDDVTGKLIAVTDDPEAVFEATTGTLKIDNPFNGILPAALKLDFDDKTPIEGAVFELYSVNGSGTETPIGSRVTTGKDGYAVFTPIYADANLNYFIREVSAGPNHMMNEFYDVFEKPVTFPAAGGDRYVVVEFLNKAGTGAEATYGVSKTVSILASGAMTASAASVTADLPLRETPLTTEYTITQAALNNTLPIENYAVTDGALTFAPAVAAGAATKPGYSITSVQVGASTAVPDIGTAASAVYARVDSIDADGKVTEGTTWELLDGDKTFILLSGSAGFKVVYNQTNTSSDPTVVGVDFTPGAITASVYINKFAPDATDLQPEITTITNTATVSTGSVVQATSTATINTPVHARPTMSVTKMFTETTPPPSYSPQAKVWFTIQMTNDSTDPLLNIESPVVIDYMPKDAMMAVLDADGKPNYRVLEGHTPTNINVVNGDVVYWYFEGLSLAPGETITIEYEAQLADVVAASNITNYALGTSNAGLNYSERYKTGASFELGDNGTNVSATEEPDLFAELGADKGLYVKSNGVDLQISLSSVIRTSRSIGTDSGATIAWNSSIVPTEVYLGGAFYYRSQTQNGLTGISSDASEIILNEALPNFGLLQTEWPEEMIDLIKIDYSSVVVTFKGTALPPSRYSVNGTGVGLLSAVLDNTLVITMDVDSVVLTTSDVIGVQYKLIMPTEEELVAAGIVLADFYANYARTLAGSNHVVTFELPNVTKRQDLRSNNVFAILKAAPLNITGTVWNDEDGKGDTNELSELSPVVYSGIKVVLYKSTTGGTSWVRQAETTTNTDGEYTFSGLESSHNGGPQYKVVFVNDDPLQHYFGPGTAFDSATTGNDSKSHVLNEDKTTEPGKVLGDTGAVLLTAPVSVINAGLCSAEYKVTYEPGAPAGQVEDMPNPSSITEKANATHVVRNEPTRPGYKFINWGDLSKTITDPGGVYLPASNFVMPTNDVVLTAQWEPDVDDIVVTSYMDYYDAAAHNITVSGASLLATDEIRYYVENGGVLTQTTTTGYTDAMEALHIWVEVYRDGNCVWGNTSALTPSSTTSANHGTVEILKVPIKVTSEHKSKPYDGTPLTGNGSFGYDQGSLSSSTRLTTSASIIPGLNLTDSRSFTYKASGQGTSISLVAGETIYVKTINSITDVGDIPNAIDVDWGSVNRLNYVLAVSEGTLAITEFEGEIVVFVSKETFTYDGTLRESYVASWTGLPTGYTVGNTAADIFATDVTGGQLVAKCTLFEVKNRSGAIVDKTTLNINYIDGYLEILPAPLVIITDSAEKTYDGNPLTAPGRISGFVNGEGAGFSAIGQQIDVGSSNNPYDLNWTATTTPTTKLSNYEVVREDIGILTVYGGPVPGGPGDPPVIPGRPSGDPDDPVVKAMTSLADALKGILESLVPLAGREGIWCWVHWYILLGLLITAAGGSFVIIRRQKFSDKLGKYEERILDRKDEMDKAV